LVGLDNIMRSENFQIEDDEISGGIRESFIITDDGYVEVLEDGSAVEFDRSFDLLAFVLLLVVVILFVLIANYLWTTLINRRSL